MNASKFMIGPLSKMFLWYPARIVLETGRSCASAGFSMQPSVPGSRLKCRAWAQSKMSTTRRATRSAVDCRHEVYVTVEWLRENLEDVIVVDVRGNVDTEEIEPGVERSTYTACKDAYLQGHIQGATFWDWTADGLDQTTDVPVQLDLNSDTFAAVAAEKGIDSERPVVLYDEGSGGSMFAFRVWWALKVHGHSDVHVLEGGWRAWMDAAGPEELTEPCPLKVMADFETSGMNTNLYAGLEEAIAAQSEDVIQLLDVRTQAQFTGLVKRAKLGGRMPSALSLPYRKLLDSKGVLCKSDTIVLTLEGAGIDLQKPVLVYCNGGVSACVVAAALESVGHRQWSVYDGSWNEYGNLDNASVISDYTSTCSTPHAP